MLEKQLAECQATNGKLRDALENVVKDDAANDTLSFDLYDICHKALALPNDATALNELIAERMKELTVQRDELNRLAEFNERTMADLIHQRDSAMEDASRYRVLRRHMTTKDVAIIMYRMPEGDTAEEVDAAITAAAPQ